MGTGRRKRDPRKTKKPRRVATRVATMPPKTTMRNPWDHGTVNGTPNGEPSQNGPSSRGPRDPRGPTPTKKDPMKDLMTRREADAAPRETRETKMAKARSQKVRSQKVRSQQKVISQLVVRSQQKPKLPRRNREVATRTAKAPVTKARSQKAKTETAKEAKEERRARSPGMMSRKSSLMLSPMRSKESSQTKNLPKNSPEVPSKNRRLKADSMA